MTDTRVQQRPPGAVGQNRIAQRQEALQCYHAQVQQEKDTIERKKRVMYEWERRGDKKVEETSRGEKKIGETSRGDKKIEEMFRGDKQAGEMSGYKEDGTRFTPLYDWPGVGSTSGSGSKLVGDGLGEQDIDYTTKGKKKGKGKGKGKCDDQLIFKEEEPAVDEQEIADQEEREMYLIKWTSLLSTDDNAVQTELRYADIPWPIYNPSPAIKPNPHHLTKESIQSFLSDLALFQLTQSYQREEKDLQKEEKRVLREAIKNYHPDRFLSKILPRVREREQEKVRAGMENCSRVLTELIMENSQ
jgi:hypothetical protein